MTFKRRHLLGLEDLNADELMNILETSKVFREVLDRPIKKVAPLRGLTVANLFFEPSTRTRLVGGAVFPDAVLLVIGDQRGRRTA